MPNRRPTDALPLPSPGRLARLRVLGSSALLAVGALAVVNSIPKTAGTSTGHALGAVALAFALAVLSLVVAGCPSRLWTGLLALVLAAGYVGEIVVLGTTNAVLRPFVDGLLVAAWLGGLGSALALAGIEAALALRDGLARLLR